MWKVGYRQGKRETVEEFKGRNAALARLREHINAERSKGHSVAVSTNAGNDVTDFIARDKQTMEITAIGWVQSPKGERPSFV